MTKREERLFRLVGALSERKRTTFVQGHSPSVRNEEIANQAEREVMWAYESLTERDKAEIRGQALIVRQVVCERADAYLASVAVVDAVNGADLADKGGPLVDYLA